MSYFGYILASARYGTLHIGITNNLALRLDQHRKGGGSEFARKHRVHRLVQAETLQTPVEAITGEKPLNGIGLENSAH